MKLPPVAVSHLQSRELIAVIGNFDEFGSENLLLYSYDGTLQHTITAPALGHNAQFGGVSENNGDIQATVGFQTDTVWKEEAGRLNLDDGTVTIFIGVTEKSSYRRPTPGANTGRFQ